MSKIKAGSLVTLACGSRPMVVQLVETRISLATKLCWCAWHDDIGQAQRASYTEESLVLVPPGDVDVEPTDDDETRDLPQWVRIPIDLTSGVSREAFGNLVADDVALLGRSRHGVLLDLSEIPAEWLTEEFVNGYLDRAKRYLGADGRPSATMRVAGYVANRDVDASVMARLLARE